MTERNMPESTGLSDRAYHLLAGDEGYDAEFKESAGGVDNDDIVAFANSAEGGVILIGVREERGENGRQEAVVIGCPVGDLEKQIILSKAQSCVPPVHVTVHEEVFRGRPFFRVEIPSGDNKPYCTSGGTYKIRGDGRTHPLLPGTLLAMFMREESEQFLLRFRSATHSLETRLQESVAQILDEMNKLADVTEAATDEISKELDASTEGHIRLE